MWSKQNISSSSFKGKYYSIKDAICNPKPLQEPYPTIMIGGSGEKYLLKVVAKHADRYNHPCGSVELLKRKISKLKEPLSNNWSKSKRNKIFYIGFLSGWRRYQYD
jgi:alkanesulfonate monooxygenase SsuD/methylene tetrahydromethanopterin reductase-like flavin-dependent oxidoreductase (luciferase family)